MKNLFITLALLAGVVTKLYAQNNFVGSKDHPIDSVEYIFPAMAEKIKKAGHQVPIPSGLMFNYAIQHTDVSLANFQMGLDPNNMVPLDFVNFSPAHSETMAYNVRLDMWVLPFLNIYGNYAYSMSTSTIEIEEPLNFPVNTSPELQNYGFGFTTAYGWNKWFMAANFNFTWSESAHIENMTKSQIISVRFGRNIKVGKNGHLAPSIGVQYQNMSPYSLGSIKTENIRKFLDNEAVHGAQDNIHQKFDNWVDGLPYGQQKIINEIVGKIENRVESIEAPEKIYYSFDKYREGNFAGIVGISYFYKNNHMFRFESAYGKGYYNILFSYNYRFGILKRKRGQLHGSMGN